MKKKLFNVFLFTAGAAVGSLVTWKVLKTRYEQIVQEEIASVKETWARMMREENDEAAQTDDGDRDDEEDEDDSDEEEFENDEPEYDPATVIAYHEIASMYKQSGDKTENSGEGDGDQEAEVPYINGPVLILPEDFGNGDYEHDLYCLTYYADGVLADDWFKKYDVDETIGEDSVEHFGEYAEDIIHVRNERLNADYEVVRDPRNYADIIHNDPLMNAYED